MPKCSQCGDKFTPKYSSLEKCCQKSECLDAFREGVLEKSKNTPAKPKNKLNKKAKCIICKNSFEPFKSSLEKCCGEIDCKVKYSMMIVEKQKKAQEIKVKKDWRKQKAEIKEKIKTLTDWHNDLQKEINAIVRTIDSQHSCISSQRPLGKSFDAGHLFGRKSNPQIRYQLFNIFAQSVHDNQHKSGNPLEFVDGIEKTFGTEIKDYCLSLKGLPALKLSIDNIKEKIPIARSILKWVKLQDRKFTTQERISLRIRFNNELQIYNPIETK